MICVVILLLCVLFSGCVEDKKADNGQIDIEESIKGEWSAHLGESTYSFTFYNDGTCKYSFGYFIMGKYYIVGDKLECHFEDIEWVGNVQNFYDIEMPDKDTLILTTTRNDDLTFDGRVEFSRLN